MPNFSDQALLDESSIRMTDDGFMVGYARCARTGVQTYLRSELGLEDEGFINVYRPESAVFAKDSIASYANRPVTINHPGEDVNSDNWSSLSKGSTGGEVLRDGDFVKVPFVIQDASAITSAKTTHKEVSMGYKAEIIMEDGIAPDGTPYGAKIDGIKINHFACVRRARGGDKLRIGDSQPDHWGASPVTPRGDASLRDHQGTKKMKTVIHDGITIEGPDQMVEAYNVVSKRLADQAAADAKKLADAQAVIDAKSKELAEKDTKLEKLEKSTLSDADLDAKIAARADLITTVHALDASIETKGLSDAAIRTATVKKIIGDHAVVGKDQVYIDARFDGLVEDAEQSEKTELNDGLAHFARAGVNLDDAAKNEDTAYGKSVDRFKRKKPAAA